MAASVAAREHSVVSLRVAGRVLGLFRGSLGIVWRSNKLLRHCLGVVVVAAGLQGLVVFVHGFGAIAFGVVGVAAFDAGPGVNPFRLAAGRVNRRLKVI